jgi:hypothetical protein
MRKIEQAASALADFRETHATEHLQSAVAALESAAIPDAADAAQRAAARAQAAKLWLAVIAAIDESIDPAFDPEDVPAKGLTPPPCGDEQLQAGADPKAIADPAARAQYEAALRENQKKAERHRLQTRLRRLEPRASFGAEAFLKLHYTASAADTKECAALIAEAGLSERRNRRLQAILQQARAEDDPQPQT